MPTPVKYVPVIDLKKDAAALPNLIALAMLEGRKLSVNDQGKIIDTGKTASKGYDVAEAETIAVHIINNLVSLRDGTEPAKLNNFAVGKNRGDKIMVEYRAEIDSIVTALMTDKTPDLKNNKALFGTHEQALHNTLNVLESLSHRRTHFSSDKEVKTACNLLNSLMSDDDLEIDQMGMDATVNLRETFVQSRDRFAGDKRDLNLPVPSWTNLKSKDLTQARREYEFDKFVKQVDDFIDLQKQRAEAKNKPLIAPTFDEEKLFKTPGQIQAILANDKTKPKVATAPTKATAPARPTVQPAVHGTAQPPRSERPVPAPKPAADQTSTQTRSEHYYSMRHREEAPTETDSVPRKRVPSFYTYMNPDIPEDQIDHRPPARVATPAERRRSDYETQSIHSEADNDTPVPFPVEDLDITLEDEIAETAQSLKEHKTQSHEVERPSIYTLERPKGTRPKGVEYTYVRHDPVDPPRSEGPRQKHEPHPDYAHISHGRKQLVDSDEFFKNMEEEYAAAMDKLRAKEREAFGLPPYSPTDTYATAYPKLGDGQVVADESDDDTVVGTPSEHSSTSPVTSRPASVIEVYNDQDEQ